MDFLASLFAPDDFARDPYGELTNQLGHTMLGLLLTLLVVCAWREADGEMPVRLHVFAVVSFGYLMAVEVLAQGWKGRDTYADWLMVSFGSGGVLWPVREVAPRPGETLLALDHVLLAWIILAWSVVLSARVLVRIRRAA